VRYSCFTFYTIAIHLLLTLRYTQLSKYAMTIALEVSAVRKPKIRRRGNNILIYAGIDVRNFF